MTEIRESPFKVTDHFFEASSNRLLIIINKFQFDGDLVATIYVWIVLRCAAASSLAQRIRSIGVVRLDGPM